MKREIAVICCSVIRNEVKHIFSHDYPDLKVEFLDSALHMQPKKLQNTLKDKLDSENLPTLVIYGDCCSSMSNFEEEYKCIRTNAVNCNELLLGKEKFREFRKRKSFLFLPEWIERWKEIFMNELGFSNADLARSLMRDNIEHLYYIDTGVSKVPTEILKEIEEYFKMPISVVTVTMDPLRNFINDAMIRLKSRYNFE